ncbi:FtsX-like permease family protein [Miniphocaeibacter massiliensis]|uniref:FtsX-like permease family protein n=1 Tax=Miniphocaeibacter massiliensis TaxID=2041841 RepID=UPI000C1BD358|nr:ABC transporter permease [Miniphocaeibacter massiliensis]
MKLIFKLAKDNLKKNKEIYLPYAISLTLSVIFFFVIINLYFNKDLDVGYKYENIKDVLSFVAIIILAISLIFNLYANSFLNKQRAKDYGIYKVLGLEKKHIRKLIFFENFILNISSIVVGLIFALILDKLNFMILGKALNFEETLKSKIDIKAIGLTLIAFLLISFLSYIVIGFKNINKNSLELLKGKTIKRRNPIINIIFGILGIILIAVGYFMAMSVGEENVEGANTSLRAVVFVIVGTYFLFIGSIILIVDLLKKNKKLYKKNNNFIAISNLSFRLKENAFGLATICILSCMIIVTLCASIIMYKSTEGLEEDYDIKFFTKNTEESKKVSEKFISIVEENNLKIKEKNEYEYMHTVGNFKKENINILKNDKGYEPYVCAMKIGDYNKLFGYDKTINENEVLIKLNSLGNEKNAINNIAKKISVFGEEFNVKEIIDEAEDNSNSRVISNEYTLIMPEKQYDKLKDTYAYELKEIELNGELIYKYEDKEGKLQDESPIGGAEINIEFFLDGDRGEIHNFFINNFHDEEDWTKIGFKDISFGLSDKYWSEDTVGVFIFVIIGVYLIIIFFINFLLVIYYKQLVEGYEDAEQFKKLRKVGLSEKEIKNTVNKQVTIFFFLPMVIAIIHFIVATNIINEFSQGLTTRKTTQTIELITILIYIIIYFIAYLLTSKKYQSIIISRNENKY